MTTIGKIRLQFRHPERPNTCDALVSVGAHADYILASLVRCGFLDDPGCLPSATFGLHHARSGSWLTDGLLASGKIEDGDRIDVHVLSGCCRRC